jgi:hypothetical protein
MVLLANLRAWRIRETLIPNPIIRPDWHIIQYYLLFVKKRLDGNLKLDYNYSHNDESEATIRAHI